MVFVLRRVHRDSASAFGDGATDMLELDGSVVDVEAVGEHVIQAEQDDVAAGGRDVFDQHMATERVGAGAEAPDVKIVYVENAFDGAHAGGDIRQVNAAGQAFEQDVQRFANDIPGGPDDQDADEKGQHGVDLLPSGVADGKTAGDDGDGAERV